MSDLLSLLLPGVPALPNVAATGMVNSAALTGMVPNSAVQVDSSSFLNILAQTNAVNTAPSTTVGDAGVVTSFTNPLAELASQAISQNPLNTAAEADKISSEGSSKLDISTILGLQSADSSKADSLEKLAAIMKNAEGAASTNNNGDVSSTDNSSGLAALLANNTYKSSVGNIQNPSAPVDTSVLNPNIVRPVASTSPESASSINQSPFTAALVGSANVNAEGAKQSQSLSKSSKLLAQLEGGAVQGEVQQVAADDSAVIEAKGTLAQANKAYQINAGHFLDGEKQKNDIQALGINKSLKLAAATAASSNNGVTINNLTLVGSAETQQMSNLTTVEIAKAHTTYASPAQQTSIKIAEAINNGTKEISFQLDPESLGHIEVKMELSKEGTSKITAYVERPETLALLKNDANLLEKVLHGAGFKTDSDSLSFNLRGEGGNSGNYAGKNDMGSSGRQPVNNEIREPLVSGKMTEYRMNLDNVIDITV